jgi:hypothetical protein
MIEKSDDPVLRNGLEWLAVIPQYNNTGFSLTHWTVYQTDSSWQLVIPMTVDGDRWTAWMANYVGTFTRDDKGQWRAELTRAGRSARGR